MSFGKSKLWYFSEIEIEIVVFRKPVWTLWSRFASLLLPCPLGVRRHIMVLIFLFRLRFVCFHGHQPLGILLGGRGHLFVCNDLSVCLAENGHLFVCIDLGVCFADVHLFVCNQLSVCCADVFLSVCNHFSVCCADEGGTVADESAQVLTVKNRTFITSL